mmetsp:Transcript_19484/g.74752  ORF Transcript_19484/g.74752 Transcript_19484/m.74752 type:complete len:205 (-) Transcript_19484:1032-1646(-)
MAVTSPRGMERMRSSRILATARACRTEDARASAGEPRLLVMDECWCAILPADPDVADLPWRFCCFRCGAEAPAAAALSLEASSAAAHASHTRTGSKNWAQGRGRRCREQAEQKTPPQRRQWCFPLKKSPDTIGAPQPWHASASASGTHATGSAPAPKGRGASISSPPSPSSPARRSGKKRRNRCDTSTRPSTTACGSTSEQGAA